MRKKRDARIIVISDREKRVRVATAKTTTTTTTSLGMHNGREGGIKSAKTRGGKEREREREKRYTYTRESPRPRAGIASQWSQPTDFEIKRRVFPSLSLCLSLFTTLLLFSGISFFSLHGGA